MEFAWIEPGAFLMGTSAAWKEAWDEENSRWSEFSPNRIPYSREFPAASSDDQQKAFSIWGTREVNRGQWFAVMGPGQRRKSALGSYDGYNYFRYPGNT